MRDLPFAVLDTDENIMYLRKSRKDDPLLSVEEVLAKHEEELQALAERELGGRIPEHCIFREIVSAETIDDRPEVCKVLSLIENPATKRVLTVEPSRLSRGDLEDCGRIVNAFRYSNTKVMTLEMTYDLDNKMHRKFFEQKLMQGNDFLEFTKEILLRGRILAIQRGSYIGNTPPFGYERTTDDIGPTLKPNDEADIVRLIFDLYVNQDMNYLQIARHLDSIGVKPRKSEIWEKSSIRFILQNPHYAGYVRFGWKKSEKVLENGQLIKKRSVPADKEDIIVARGRHQALVSQELYDAAQEKMALHGNYPRSHWGAPLQNPLAGVIFCSKCGKAMKQHPYKHARTRIECNNRNGCGSKSIPLEELVDAVAFALEREQLPELETKLKNNDGNAYIIQQRQLKQMRGELEELHRQEEMQFTLLEKGRYTEDVFEKRNNALHVEMDALKTRIYEAQKALPKEIDYAEKIVTLKKAVAGLRDDDVSVEAKNKLIKAIVKRIDYEYIAWEGKGKIRYKLHIELLI